MRIAVRISHVADTDRPILITSIFHNDPYSVGAIQPGDIVTHVTTHAYRESGFHPLGEDGKERLRDILLGGRYPIELSLKRTACVAPSISDDYNVRNIRMRELHFGGNKLIGGRAFDWDRFVFKISHLPLLEYLDLDRNHVGRNACEAIAGYLSQGGSRLHTLFLRENLIDDECADLLIPALEYNTSLRKLYLQKNQLTSRGRGRFLELLGYTSSPYLTYHSNHTLCELRWDVSGVHEPLKSILKLNDDKLNDGTAVSVRSKRRNKILLAHYLHSPLDVAPFSDLDVRVMPHLLAWFGVNEAGRRGRRRFHETIHNVHTPFDDRGQRFRALHALVREWNVPALFGNPSPERRRMDELEATVDRLRREKDAAVEALRAENAGLAEENRRLREEIESIGGRRESSWWNWKRRKVS